MDFNRNVGISIEECYQQHKDIIYQLARKSRGALKDIYAMDMDDLYQIATVGFLNAYMDYQEGYNTNFLSYAHNRIKWELYNTLKKRHSIHFPSSFIVIWNIVAKYHVNESNLHELDKRKPKAISDSVIKVAMSWMGRTTPSSLDKPVSTETSDDKAQELYDVIVGSTSDETTAIVLDFLDSLNEKQACIVSLLLEDKTQSEIAQEVELSQSQVSRNIKAIQKRWMAYLEEVDA